MAYGIFLDQGFERMSPAWAGGFLPLSHPGSLVVCYRKNSEQTKSLDSLFSILCSSSSAWRLAAPRGTQWAQALILVSCIGETSQEGLSHQPFYKEHRPIPSAFPNMYYCFFSAGRVPRSLTEASLGMSIVL